MKYKRTVLIRSHRTLRLKRSAKCIARQQGSYLLIGSQLGIHTATRNDETTFWHRDSFKKAKPNSVGLINWLRQPGQLRCQPPKSMVEIFNPLIKSCVTRTDSTAETKSIGLPADALVPCFLLAT
jgi:hypothetical protein